MVALVDPLAVALCRGDRELHLELAAFELARELETGRLEDAQHVAVVRQHLRDEALDSLLGGTGGELLEQPRADPAALVVVGDRERRFRDGRVAEAHVVGDRDDALGAVDLERPEQRAALVPVGLERRLDEPWAEVREAVEAEVEAALRERPEEVEQRVRVVPAGRAQPERAPVAEDDVGRELLGRHGD